MIGHTARERKDFTASVLLAQAAEYEREAMRAIHASDKLRMRGRALQLRGSAWVMQAELKEATE